MEKLTAELITDWIASNPRFEMRCDGGSLYLTFRTDQKGPIWLFRFRQFGEQHKLSLGACPAISLESARDLARSYRKLIESNEGVIAVVGNRRRGDSDKELARTFSALLREASLHGAKRMSVTIEFEGEESWAS